jgi:hypothetical protein
MMMTTILRRLLVLRSRLSGLNISKKLRRGTSMIYGTEGTCTCTVATVLRSLGVGSVTFFNNGHEMEKMNRIKSNESGLCTHFA